ncbi:hypothetical protein RUM43_014840 [Polyplax serrata]|uniref:DDB1- and CUL4-associated factor 15 WD40 repeat-containing domain-containing protein n=1 Tax=Polyplax serrata TaxID=468196 RepID=A0AAN8P434_POLSC
MSDWNSDLDEVDFISELGSAETISSSSFSPGFNHDLNISILDYSMPMGFGCLKPVKQTVLKSYYLSNIFPHQVLQSHIFMGMTKCGRFLITYTMTTDQDDDEWYATVYKYRLHWWNFKPGGQARKIAEVSLFGNHKVIAPLQIYVCQWPKDHEKILVYGIIRDSCNIDASGASNNRHAFVTVTALPSLNDCPDCRVVASSYMLDDIAASWDTCLRFSCLKHGYTIHTSFDVVIPYPEFLPKISLKCNDYAVFNANNFLYAIRITLGNSEKKVKDDTDEVPYQISVFESEEESNNMTEEGVSSWTVNSIPDGILQTKGFKLKEQIIQDFSEEVNLSMSQSTKKFPEGIISEDCSVGVERTESPSRFVAEVKTEKQQETIQEFLTSPPLPTRVHLTQQRYEFGKHLDNEIVIGADNKGCKQDEKMGKSNNVDTGDIGLKKKDSGEKDCFRCPMSPSQMKRNRAEQKKGNSTDKGRSLDIYKADNNNCSKKCYKSFFTRQGVQNSNLNLGVLIRNMSFSKSMHKAPKGVAETEIHPVLESTRHRLRTSKENTDSPYEFVDDTQHEVEKLSQFRKKRLADKKYEFQDFDSENIVPFSIVRQENTLKSPKKFSEPEAEVDSGLSLNIELRFGNDGLGPSEMNDMILRSPSPRYPLDLSISVPSPRSPLILEILSSPTQYDGVLRPFNRNTNGNALLSPMAKFVPSPPTSAQKPKSSGKDGCKAKGCDEVKITKCCKSTANQLDTRLILENGILINDISEWYFKEDIEYEEADIYKNLYRNLNRFYGEAVRFERRFVEVDDELVSVITDIEDDDMSAVTGYHTALNVEVHGAGYSQLQMVSNSKVEKLAAPCVVVDQQSLDIEGICHSVATTLCQVSNKTFTFCNDYDIEILDVCPRSGDVLVLLMMRIEGSEGIKDEVSKLEQYEASVTLVWNLHTGNYKVCMNIGAVWERRDVIWIFMLPQVVPPQKVKWAWNSKALWNPAKEASKRFRMKLPADVTLCEPAVRVCRNNLSLRGISITRIEDIENGVQFIL